MRIKSCILGLLIMVLCIGFGMFFPHIVFSKTFNEPLSQVEKYEIEPVEMGNSNTVIDAIRACRNSSYVFDYEEDMANLSREQLIDICNSFLQNLKLEEWGYNQIIVNDSNMKATCQLEVSNYDEEFVISTTIWNVEVEYSPNCFLALIVDDKNQKVVQTYSYYSYDDSINNNVSSYTDGTSIYLYLSEVIVPYLEDYYDAEVEIVDDIYSEYIISITDKNKDVVLMQFDLNDGAPYLITLR